MKSKTIVTGLLAAFLFSGIGLLAAAPADAVTCRSVCNQIRRACQHSAKGAWKAQRVVCDQQETICHNDCTANAATCEADCAAGDLQCLDDCVNCDANCDTGRDTCRDDAKTARNDLRALCTVARTTCDDQCIDPIDGLCVRGCTKQEHDCTAAAKRDEKGCKRACATGGERKNCFKECRRIANTTAQFCEDDAVFCYSGCAGVDLTPPTTLP